MINSLPFDKELLKENPRVIAQYLYSAIKDKSDSNWVNKQKTPFKAKDIDEIPGLIKKVIESSEEREETIEENKILFTTEAPDFTKKMETITYSVARREPGGVGQGSPFNQQGKNLRPTLREEVDDPNDPDYKVAVYGYVFDNIIKLKCWSHTSWQAEKRAIWLEKKMQEYDWWLTMQGVLRFMYFGRDEDEEKTVDGNKIYGKTIKFYVRTERLTEVSTKKLEQLIIKISVQGGQS